MKTILLIGLTMLLGSFTTPEISVEEQNQQYNQNCDCWNAFNQDLTDGYSYIDAYNRYLRCMQGPFPDHPFQCMKPLPPHP